MNTVTTTLRIALLIPVIVLAGCLGNESGSDDSARIDCADVHNEGQADLCAPAAKIHGVTQIAAGVVSRGQMVEATLVVTNHDTVVFTGYVHAVFDAGCNGAATWELVSYNYITIQPEETYQAQFGGECGDMALGARTLTASILAADASTVVDQTVVNFDLVE